MNGDSSGPGRNKQIDHISKLNQQKQKWKKSAVVCLSSADQSDDSDLDDRNDRKRLMLRDTPSLVQKNSIELNDNTLQQRQPDAATSSSSLFEEKDVIKDLSLDTSSCCDDSTFLDYKQNVHQLQQRYDSSIAELRRINQRQIRIEDYDFFEKYVKPYSI